MYKFRGLCYTSLSEVVFRLQNDYSHFDTVYRLFKFLGLIIVFFLQLSDEDISKYWEEYSIYDRHINAFFQLRTTLAPSIESVILLDRLCYLLEQVNQCF